jgi:xanthine dehydrogenase/oxidase
MMLQIEGAFMQGVGYVMTEEVVEDESSGVNLTDNTWTYKPPGIAELPKVSSRYCCGFRV